MMLLDTDAAARKMEDVDATHDSDSCANDALIESCNSLVMSATVRSMLSLDNAMQAPSYYCMHSPYCYVDSNQQSGRMNVTTRRIHCVGNKQISSLRTLG